MCIYMGNDSMGFGFIYIIYKLNSIVFSTYVIYLIYLLFSNMNYVIFDYFLYSLLALRPNAVPRL